MIYLSPKLLKAFEFAAVAHKQQFRKNPVGVPYIAHPAAVAHVLAGAGFSEDVVMAGLLHDVVEDTSVALPDIEKEFGEVVGRLVDGVTERKELPWVERKQVYNEHLKNAEKDVVAISAADLLANQLALLVVLRKGENPWLTFNDPPNFSGTHGDYVSQTGKFHVERIQNIRNAFPDLPYLPELEEVNMEVARLSAKYYSLHAIS